ncbi:hypothetical protein BS78_07G038200 [Paspalum vaginatum]|nr:hypothetical protein BS78_07G038200 [Paspalum vaginatum]
MFYTAIDTFYLTDEQLLDSPSRKDGIDEATESALRVYGCDLIQESGILLKLARRVAASCVWLAGKLEESPRKSEHIIFVFHRMECRRESLPIELLDVSSDKYSELRNDLIRTERRLLKEMGFICHVEHPHNLRTTLCVRFKSEVVACGVVYAAARRHHVPLPEDPPWWTVFDADEAGIQEVCRVLAHLYSLPKAQYIPVYKDNDSFTVRRISGPQDSKERPASSVASDKGTPVPSSSSQEEDSVASKVKEKSDGEGKPLPAELDGKENQVSNSKKEKSDSGVDQSQERERSRSRGWERSGRGRDSDHERDRRHHPRERSSGHLDKEKSRRHSSRDRGNYYSSHSSREKDRHRHR